MSHFIGEIRRFTPGNAPGDWVVCDGRLLSIADHQPLFSLLAWRFGGDGRATFAIPAMRSADRSLEHAVALNGLYPSIMDDSMFEDTRVGEIRLFGGETPPAGWIKCDGRSLPIGEPFLELFDVIGKTWGGDAEHFAVPDLRGAEDDGVVGTPGRLSYIIAVARKRPEST